MSPKKENIFRREEIIEGKVRICGYRFSLLTPNSPAIDYIAALSANDLQSFAEKRTPFIVITAPQWQQADFSAIIGANTLFQLSMPENPDENPVWLETLRQIREKGAGIAIAVNSASKPTDPHLAESLKLANVVVLDFPSYGFPDIAIQIRQWREAWSEVDVAIDNLQSWYDQIFCISQGARYSLGSFVFTDRAEV